MLTVLIPITDTDAVIVNELPDVDSRNINVIYKYDGVYKRVQKNAQGVYAYADVVDREFPYIGKPLEIFDFTYDATRMGTAPTISAQGVMWFADKDENGKDVTLEDMWLLHNKDCHVSFNGENFYLKQVPTCSKDNGDARYKYDIDFVSERVVLENVYLYDVVQPFVTERPISESSKFSFYGNVNELVKRINASLLRSGLAKIRLRNNQAENIHPRMLADDVTKAADNQYFSYQEWNAIGSGEYSGPLSIRDPYNTRNQYGEYDHYHNNIFDHYNGDYNAYLRNEVFAIGEDGDVVMSGYICRTGKDEKGEQVSSEEKLITFENNTIHEALQRIHDTFELQYYITLEIDDSGDFTGNTIIMIADCEHDFADIDGNDFVRDSDGLPTTEHPFDYGVDNELLSKEKTNTTDKIITRITGTGSTENIPWYYPNPTADGWIKPVYKRNGEVLPIDINYPKNEGSTVHENVLYEKYLKNRIGDVFQFGKLVSNISELSFVDGYGEYTTHIDENDACICYNFILQEQTRLRISPFTCSFHDVSIQCILYDGYDSVLSEDISNTFLNGGTVNLGAGNYHLIFELTFLSGGPTPITNVNKYYYPTEICTCGFLDTWSWRLLLVALSGIGSPAAIIAYIKDMFGGGFNSSIPGFFSTNPNLKYKPSSDAAIMGWYDGDRRISKSEMEFGEENTDYYAFLGGDGEKTLGVDDVYKIHYTKEKIESYNLQLLGYDWNDAYDTYGFVMDMINGLGFWEDTPSAIEEVDIDIDTFITSYINFSTDFYIADGWYCHLRKQNLADFGISLPSDITHDVSDTIEFQRVKYVTPQPTLMPELYIKTDGERRFYNAINYDPVRGSADEVDTFAGEEYVDRTFPNGTFQTGIINKIYSKNGDGRKHYDFENEYIKLRPHEHIESFDDVKPTITGQINTVNGQSFRIDVVEEFAFDALDNDEIWENNDNGNISGEYKHPYFFAKLRPLGFNLFDLALQEDMVLSMTTGHCGACNFKIGVDENTKKNPVQIWQYDVYEGSDYNTKALRYHAGDLRRHIDTSNLYYDTTGDAAGYTHVNGESSLVVPGFLVSNNSQPSNSSYFQRRIYSANKVKAGEVGALKQENITHFAGDVLTSGRFIESQQDTSENYVWVALMKDTDSYGVLMPSAKPNYVDSNFSVYIRPASVTDTGNEDTADKFVLTNIRLPQTYLRWAEKELSRRLVEYMYDNNYQKFNFSIGFSRIFLGQNADVEDNLNENSVMYVSFNNKTYRQYAKHYSYRMSKDAVLPEISVDMNEELSVSRTKSERDAMSRLEVDANANARISNAVLSVEQRVSRRTIGRNADTLIGGNIVSIGSSTSLHDLQMARATSETMLSRTKIDLAVNHFRKSDFVINGQRLEIGDNIKVPTKNVFDAFVSSVNTFNTNSAQRMNQIKNTIEHRLPIAAGGVIEEGCDAYKFNHDETTHTTELLWYNADGTVTTISDTICSTSTNMTSITWTNFEITN